MDKKKNNTLISIADTVLRISPIFNRGNISDSYNGCVASFGVSVAMSGLRPTLTIYFHKEDRRNILEIIAQMLTNNQNVYFSFDDNVRNGNNPITVTNAETMLRYAYYCSDAQLKKLQTAVIDCSIALKQVIRTYNLVSNGNN